MTLAPPDCSVVIPFRNAGDYFEPLLRSVISQVTDQSTEVILVDNGSTDGSRHVAESMSGLLPIRIVDARERANGSYARNVGVLHARGEKLFFVDSDDELAPGYLQTLARALDDHYFVTSTVDSTSLNPEWVREAHGSPWEGILMYFDFLPGTGVNIGVRREVFDAIGGFDPSFTGSQDVVFSWRAQQCGYSIHFVPEAVYRYRYRSSLAGLYRQTRNWGYSNVLLYRTFREAGMPGRPLSVAVREWCGAVAALARARGDTERAIAVVRCGYCIGRIKGSVHYRRVYL